MIIIRISKSIILSGYGARLNIRSRSLKLIKKLEYTFDIRSGIELVVSRSNAGVIPTTVSAKGKQSPSSERETRSGGGVRLYLRGACQRHMPQLYICYTILHYHTTSYCASYPDENKQKKTRVNRK